MAEVMFLKVDTSVGSGVGAANDERDLFRAGLR